MPRASKAQRYVAFLRAINVGGHIVKMDQLRKLFEGLRLANVETFIASGNVIFDCGAEDAQKLERRIEAHLQKSLGYPWRRFCARPRSCRRSPAPGHFPKLGTQTTAHCTSAFSARHPMRHSPPELSA
jgi:uncharacterized protein (DUF1697 family)